MTGCEICDETFFITIASLADCVYVSLEGFIKIPGLIKEE